MLVPELAQLLSMWLLRSSSFLYIFPASSPHPFFISDLKPVAWRSKEKSPNHMARRPKPTCKVPELRYIFDVSLPPVDFGNLNRILEASMPIGPAILFHTI